MEMIVNAQDVQQTLRADTRQNIQVEARSQRSIPTKQEQSIEKSVDLLDHFEPFLSPLHKE